MCGAVGRQVHRVHTDLVAGSHSDCGQHQFECEPGEGNCVASSTGKAAALHEAPPSVERFAPREHVAVGSPGHLAAYSLKAIRVPFPSADSAAAAAAGTNTSDGIAPPAKTIEGQRWLGGHGGGGGGVQDGSHSRSRASSGTESLQ
jgi:hypothetical protein